ncbi:porin [Microvirga arsenatis]|uniref:Porin n=1 Tax=Microvirga arsenatis TaxID=2692265 RepID=A0ABW9Z8Y6_9HYPH|nr:porin [Microvirga arsenatis]NBJ13933.1 porin [Microvirga arsenatis]NBJ27381.1 porin [Microvirga arsenatis]
MKLAKSLFLGSVAGLAAVAGAQAADLPVKKAAAVEYVRVCSTYGAGFFYIPGTETCLRVGGRVRADYVYGEPFDRSQDAIGFRARGRVQLDARTQTAYGLLRSVVRLELTRSSGTPLFAGSGAVTTSPQVQQAYIQFGGLTAGRVTSFFSNADLPTGHMGTLRFDDAPDIPLLAYTYSFGNGFSATLSLEDSLERRLNSFVAGSPAASGLVYAGQRVPDVVANLKYTGTWGGAQLSGAVHQIRSDNLFVDPVTGLTDFPDTEYGFAIAGTAYVNLPMLAPGDAAWVAATYTRGALGYLNGGFVATTLGGNLSPFTAVGTTLGLADAYINSATGDIEQGEGWSVAGGLRHYWTPQVRQNIFGSYMRVEYGAGAAFVSPTTGLVSGLNDFTEWRLGTNVFWQPVSGLDLGVEIMYVNQDPGGRVFVPATGQILGADSAWEGRLRVQRDF